MVLERFEAYRSQIVTRINGYFDDLDTRVDLPWWTGELTREFRDFSTKGKLVRGCLLLLSYELFNRNDRVLSAPIDAAAALEIVHSAVLIQDDVMDRDTKRRGAEATHVRLAEGFDAHTGESLASCVVDAAFFSSYDLLAQLDVDEQVLRDVIRFYSFELTKLGLSQMEDVALAASNRMPERSDIETVLIEKSGRYTFSLPLMMGAMIAGAPEQRAFLERFGERLGLVFQIKDDELALFGDPEMTGKPIGGDVREGKKTLFWFELMQAVSDDERSVLDSVYGDPHASADDIARVMDLFETHDIRENVLAQLDPIADELRTLINKQDVTDTQKRPFIELLEWNLSRKK